MCLGVAEPGLALGRVLHVGRHAVVASGGGAFQTGRPDVVASGGGAFDAAGRTLDFELDPAAGTLTVRLDGAPHHVFTGLGGEAWCPVINMYNEGSALEALPSPSAELLEFLAQQLTVRLAAVLFVANHRARAARQV